jgi:hypothetical protein
MRPRVILTLGLGVSKPYGTRRRREARMNSFRGGRKGISQELCWEPLDAGTKNWRPSSKRSRVSHTLYTSRSIVSLNQYLNLLNPYFYVWDMIPELLLLILSALDLAFAQTACIT